MFALALTLAQWKRRRRDGRRMKVCACHVNSLSDALCHFAAPTPGHIFGTDRTQRSALARCLPLPDQRDLTMEVNEVMDLTFGIALDISI
jgi:hypothetical protein